MQQEKCNKMMQQRMYIKSLEGKQSHYFFGAGGQDQHAHLFCFELKHFFQGTLQTVCAKDEKNCDRL